MCCNWLWLVSWVQVQVNWVRFTKQMGSLYDSFSSFTWWCLQWSWCISFTERGGEKEKREREWPVCYSTGCALLQLAVKMKTLTSACEAREKEKRKQLKKEKKIERGTRNWTEESFILSFFPLSLSLSLFLFFLLFLFSFFFAILTVREGRGDARETVAKRGEKREQEDKKCTGIGRCSNECFLTAIHCLARCTERRERERKERKKLNYTKSLESGGGGRKREEREEESGNKKNAAIWKMNNNLRLWFAGERRMQRRGETQTAVAEAARRRRTRVEEVSTSDDMNLQRRRRRGSVFLGRQVNWHTIWPEKKKKTR